jgi:nitrite reductase/ring-hydroxylating ferredoxin subunit
MKKNIILILFLSVALSCKEEFYSTIPYAPVRLTLDLNTYDYQLNTPLSYSIFSENNYPKERPLPAVLQIGYGGLLIVNGIGADAVNIYAYDLACPNEANRSALIVPENMSEPGIPTAITAKCPKCGAVYNIIDGLGAPQSGSTYYLRTYRVIKRGEKIFEVSN